MMRMSAGLRNRMKARTSLYSVIRPLLTLPTAGTMSTVALKERMDSYSTEMRFKSDALSAVSRVWVGALLPRVMTRRRARQDVRIGTEHKSATVAAARRNSITSHCSQAQKWCVNRIARRSGELDGLGREIHGLDHALVGDLGRVVDFFDNLRIRSLEQAHAVRFTRNEHGANIAHVFSLLGELLAGGDRSLLRRCQLIHFDPRQFAVDHVYGHESVSFPMKHHTPAMAEEQLAAELREVTEARAAAAG